MRWRETVTYGWLLVTLGLFSGFAWLTRHPDSELLETATSWPGVGELAERFRRAYLPAPTGMIRDEPAAVIQRSQPRSTASSTLDEPVGERPWVWVGPGTPIFARADDQSPILVTTASIRNLPVVFRQGDWYRVQVSGMDGGQGLAWVHLPGYVEPTPEALSRPEPVVPLPAAAIDDRTLALAAGSMSGRGRAMRCGSYDLWTDVVTHPLIDLCPHLGDQIEEVFRRRYGLEPVGPAAETIVLFQRRSDYLGFRQRDAVDVETAMAHAVPSRGYLALYVGDRPLAELQQTLAHEMTHLVSRRTIGPSLPPWLGEGLADDLAESEIGPQGSITPGRIGGQVQVESGRVVRTGGIAAVITLQNELEVGDLPTLRRLIDMGQVEFRQPQDVELHYALASAWVRYFLSGFDEALADGFRSFLRRVAAGAPLTPDLLRQSLGTDWETLEQGFRTWLRLRFLMPLDEIADRSE